MKILLSIAGGAVIGFVAGVLGTAIVFAKDGCVVGTTKLGSDTINLANALSKEEAHGELS